MRFFSMACPHSRLRLHHSFSVAPRKFRDGVPWGQSRPLVTREPEGNLCNVMVIRARDDGRRRQSYKLTW
jgi:hypothetical protein